jgi:hypothetical protein
MISPSKAEFFPLSCRGSGRFAKTGSQAVRLAQETTPGTPRPQSFDFGCDEPPLSTTHPRYSIESPALSGQKLFWQYSVVQWLITGLYCEVNDGVPKEFELSHGSREFWN